MVTSTRPVADVEHRPAYLMAFTDWLACASAGAAERAARAVRASGDDLLADVAFAATAGHVLDFDDTLADGVAHVSSTTAPAALVLAARRGLSLQAALHAYAEGYEAMAAVVTASHPSLYDGGWHPTAVCGPVGAVVAASRLLSLTPDQRRNAIAVALLRAGGTRGAFGSDGKAIQVGLAAAAGVQAALVAQAGASVDPRAVHGPLGFAAVFGAAWPEDGLRGPKPAIARNWIKLHPSCLGTHSPIDAATKVRERLDGGRLQVAVHPVARQAAHLDAVTDGLSAKFSIPYCVAHTILRGPPRVGDFGALDDGVAARARDVSVSVDDSLPEWGAVLSSSGCEPVRVDSPRGAPDRPLDQSELAAKVADLAGPGLLEALGDLGGPAAGALRAAGLEPPAVGV
ncbi:MAG TPA: MmgE/PrpD family protein [Solirubrobacteraceae bacterium]|jgi:2-methylcitrate dehydratase PrpD